MNELISKALQEFDKKFVAKSHFHENGTVEIVGKDFGEEAIFWNAPAIKAFLEKTLTSAITKAFEEVKVTRSVGGGPLAEEFNYAVDEFESRKANFLLK